MVRAISVHLVSTNSRTRFGFKAAFEWATDQRDALPHRAPILTGSPISATGSKCGILEV